MKDPRLSQVRRKQSAQSLNPSPSRRFRFTLDGSPQLEQYLGSLCQDVRRAVLRVIPQSKLAALVLGGGYGRGQGGVLKTPTGDCPYNDLEFYIFLTGALLFNEVMYRRKLQSLGEEFSHKAGLHIEFKIDSLRKFRARPVSIFSYDLVSAHRTLYARKPPFRDCQTHLNVACIAPSEATRLLLNRCSGLLLSQELLNKRALTAEESDFVGRNLAKAKLALGDALLAAEGRYNWDCLERARRLRALDSAPLRPFVAPILEHHAAGIEFKLHPTRIAKSAEEFRSEHREVTRLAMHEWLAIENLRLKSSFSTLRDYSFSSILKCADTRRWRNILLNIRTFGAGATLDSHSPRYPRERLFNALPLLLGNEEAIAEVDTRRHLQELLRTQAQDWSGLVAAYKQVWSCYA